MVRFNDLTISEKGNKAARFDKLAEEIDANVAGDSSIAGRVGDLETAVGSATGDNPGGLAKDMADAKAVIGDAETANTLVYDVADIKAYIGEILAANDTLTDPRAETPGDG